MSDTIRKPASSSTDILSADGPSRKFPTDLSLLYGIAIGILAVILLLIIIFLCCDKIRRVKRRVRFARTSPRIFNEKPSKKKDKVRNLDEPCCSNENWKTTRSIENIPMEDIQSPNPSTVRSRDSGNVDNLDDETLLRTVKEQNRYASVLQLNSYRDPNRNMVVRRGADEADIKKWLSQLCPSTITPPAPRLRPQKKMYSDPVRNVCHKTRLPKFSLAGEPILTSSEPSFISAMPFMTSSPEQDEPPDLETPQQNSLIVPTNTPNSRCSQSDDDQDSIFNNANMPQQQDSDFGASAGVSHCDVSSNTSMNVIVESLASVSFAWDAYDPSFCEQPVSYVDGAYVPILTNRQYWV